MLRDRLDTTIVIDDYFPIKEKIDLRTYRADRLMYGSDFPNIPFAWDRELKCQGDAELSEANLDRILNKNAAAFFDLESNS